MTDYKGMLRMEVEGLCRIMIREDHQRDSLDATKKARYHDLLKDKLRVMRVINGTGKYKSWAEAKVGVRALALNYGWGKFNRIIKIL